MVVKRRSSSKNPPIFSHEFVIQNHADIVACVAMVFVVGLMFQISSPLASVFVALNHSETVPGSEAPPGAPLNQAGEAVLYKSGWLDVPCVFFYVLITIVMHQILQEYLLDKINRKFHLSKAKHSKFNESGQLLAFSLVSVCWAVDIMIREQLLASPRSLWEGYPHANMTFSFKFFYIFQLSYWLHVFPELYFQKVRKEDMSAKIMTACTYLVFITGAYAFTYTRIGLFLLAINFFIQSLYHSARLLHYADKLNLSAPLFKLHDIFFVLGRLGSVILTVLTFWYGLALSPPEQQVLNVQEKRYNTPLFRLNALVGVCLLQAYLMWSFITLHLRLRREAAANNAPAYGIKTRSKTTQQDKASKRKQGKKEEEDVNELTEVDQNTKKSLRQRK